MSVLDGPPTRVAPGTVDACWGTVPEGWQACDGSLARSGRLRARLRRDLRRPLLHPLLLLWPRVPDLRRRGEFMIRR